MCRLRHGPGANVSDGYRVAECKGAVMSQNRGRPVVTGRLPLFPVFTPPNWASDHAGVFATLIFP